MGCSMTCKRAVPGSRPARDRGRSGAPPHRPARARRSRARAAGGPRRARRSRRRGTPSAARAAAGAQRPAAAARPATACRSQRSVLIERRHEVAEIDPLERGAHRRIVEAVGLGGVAHGGAQRAGRQIGSLRHEHHRVARRQLDRPRRPTATCPRAPGTACSCRRRACRGSGCARPGPPRPGAWSSVAHSSGSATPRSSSTSFSAPDLDHLDPTCLLTDRLDRRQGVAKGSRCAAASRASRRSARDCRRTSAATTAPG